MPKKLDADEDTVRIAIPIPVGMRAKYQQLCASNGVKMADDLRDYIETKIRRAKPRNRILETQE